MNDFPSLARTLKEKRLSTVAGAWVFYFLTSVVSLVFLMVTAFGVFGFDLSRDIVSRLPEEFRQAGEAILTTAENASGGATVFFIATVLFSSTTLLNQMSKDGDFIYGAESSKRGVFRRLRALFAIAVLFALFLVAAFLAAFGSMLFPGLSIGGTANFWGTLLFFLFTILFGYVIIIMLNGFISPVRLKFRHSALGSLVSLFIIVLGTIGFTLYLRFFGNYNAFYGSLAAIVIFLLWAYILMLGLATGVILNMRTYYACARGDDDVENKKSDKKLRRARACRG